jgi:hypothetical protein
VAQKIGIGVVDQRIPAKERCRQAEKKDGNSISEDGTLNEWISESEP